VGIGAHPVGHTASRRHVGGRHLVDWVVRLLFRQPNVSSVCFSSVLPAVVGSTSRSCVNHIVSLLQQGSADAANRLFVIAGVLITQDGMQLSIPMLSVEVAAEYSIICSSLMLLVTCMVLAHLLLRSI